MSKEPQPVPEEIKHKVRASGQQRYGDKTVYSHQQQACYEAGAKFGYSLAVSEIEKLKRLLHDLTPGGSEFFNDPEYCAKWIRESRESNHYQLCETIKTLKSEISTLQKTVERLATEKRELKEEVAVHEKTIEEQKKEILDWQRIAKDALSGDENMVLNAWVKHNLGDTLKKLQALRAVLLQCEGKPGVNTLGEIIDKIDSTFYNPPKI